MNIKKVLEKHLRWLQNEEGGKRADLSGANLSRADLSGANLSEADLSRADLSGADLSGANLYEADLSRADLSGADLSGANLYEADLSGANLSRADLSGANLSRADLSGANLSEADLYGADLYGIKNFYEIENIIISHTSICPEGSIIGWKKCRDDIIVKLEIPTDARRSNSTGRKCRAEYAKVLEIFGADIAVSQYDSNIKYKAGDIVYPDKWDNDRWNECSSGIHFFITRYEAEQY